MSEWRRVSTGNQWERRYGYSRGVRVGSLVFLGGAAPVDPDGSTHAPGDAAAQTARCYRIIDGALLALGAARENVVRVRLYVTDISRHDEIGLAHRAYFGDHAPCMTMVEVSALISPDMLVEIEADAVVGA